MKGHYKFKMTEYVMSFHDKECHVRLQKNIYIDL